MKIAYQQINFPLWKIDMIEQVNSIIAEYEEQGYHLTLRQVYYQFVSRDILPERWADSATGSTNNERSYKNLGELINTGRLAGLISWRAIEDRTRELSGNSHWRDPADIMNSVRHSYAIDKWVDQDYRVEVWVEKDAIEGIVSRPARELDIDYFSCRGYTSQTAMHDAAMRLKRYVRQGQKCYIIHLGDHDPSGIDMTRDIEERLRLFLGPDSGGFELRRIALNMEQVKFYKPPNNPAKVTDSRAKDYIAKHGVNSWELDALEPSVIDKLIRDEVATLRNDLRYKRLSKREEADKDLMQKASENWGELAHYINENF